MDKVLSPSFYMVFCNFERVRCPPTDYGHHRHRKEHCHAFQRSLSFAFNVNHKHMGDITLLSTYLGG